MIVKSISTDKHGTREMVWDMNDDYLATTYPMFVNSSGIESITLNFKDGSTYTVSKNV